eukprot:SAG11_NODE_3663_length_2301_cov_1.770209_3_plen_51_part_00
MDALGRLLDALKIDFDGLTLLVVFDAVVSLGGIGENGCNIVALPCELLWQ